MNKREPKIELTGKRVWYLTGVSSYFDNKRNKTFWNCVCDCGNMTTVDSWSWRTGHIKSCGCYNKNRLKTHGCSRINMTEYTIWAKIIQRCYNKNAFAYSRYGGRGIKMCKKWKESFQSFFNDMGKRPSKKHSIERVNNDGNYEPSNCVWATIKTQLRNRGDYNRILKFNGEEKCVSAWAEDFNLPITVLWNRVYSGWSAEDILTRPIKKYKKRKICA